MKLNKKTHTSILTPVGETDTATIINGLGQGSFAAALASSIYTGNSVYNITKGEFTSTIGPNLSGQNCKDETDNGRRKKRRYGDWKNAGKETTEGKCRKIQVCGDGGHHIKEIMPKVSGHQTHHDGRP